MNALVARLLGRRRARTRSMALLPRAGRRRDRRLLRCVAFVDVAGEQVAVRIVIIIILLVNRENKENKEE